VGRILLFLAGARPDILERVPTERVKFSSLGATVLAASAVAAVSMTFALRELDISFVLAVPMAILWWLVIAGIDRWMITSFPIDGRRRWIIALPRILLAALFGNVTATPVVLFVFRRKILAELPAMHGSQLNGIIPQLHALGGLSSHSAVISASRWLLYAFFVLIEISPVVGKLLQRPGFYEQILLHTAERELESARRMLRTQEVLGNRPDATHVASSDDPIGPPDDPVDIGLRDMFLRLGPPSEGQGPSEYAREGDGGGDL